MTQIPEEISPQELKQLRMNASDSTLLVDVRDSWEVKLCHIEDSMHLPLSQLILETPTFEKNKLIVTYCHHGVRSRTAMLILRQKGFTQVASLKGGIDSWSKQIDPSVPVY